MGSVKIIEPGSTVKVEYRPPCGECRPIRDRTIQIRCRGMNREDREDLGQDHCERCVRYRIMDGWQKYGVKLSTWVNLQVKHQLYYRSRSAKTGMRSGQGDTLPLGLVAFSVRAKADDVITRLDVKGCLEDFPCGSGNGNCGRSKGARVALGLVFTGSSKTEASKAVGMPRGTLHAWFERVGDQLRSGGVLRAGVMEDRRTWGKW